MRMIKLDDRGVVEWTARQVWLVGSAYVHKRNQHFPPGAPFLIRTSLLASLWNQLPRLGWRPSGISGISSGCNFVVSWTCLQLFYPHPRPVTSSDVKCACLSNDDVVRLDLPVTWFGLRPPLMGEFFSEMSQPEHHD